MEVNQPTKTSVNKKLFMNLEELDLEQITFKPLTRGLGFHQERREISKIRPKLQTPRPVHPVTKAAPVVATKKIEIPETADISKRVMSFLIDLVLLVFATLLTILVLGLAAGLPWDVLGTIFTFKEIFLFTFSLYSIYFFFYFSVLDMSATLGKTMMRIELRTVDNKRPSLANGVSRAFVVFVSFPFLGLPLLGGIQDKFSGTKVYKCLT